MSTIKEFCQTELNINFESEEDAEEFCKIFGFYRYNKEEIKNELSDDLQISEYLIDFIDIDALAEDNQYKKLNDDLFIDINQLETFKSELEQNYNNDVQKLLKSVM